MSLDTARELLERLQDLEPRLYGGDFLLTWEKSWDDIQAVLLLAEALEHVYRAGLDTRAFRGGLAVSIFRDKSTRTRLSFSSAASLLGLSHMDLDESKSQVAHGETVRETANMLSFLTEVVGIRDDLFLGYGHAYELEFSQALQRGYEEGVLPQRPAVINLQCDLDHPTQSLADLLHLKRTFGSLEALRGRKLVMSWAYSPSYGKPLSVAQGTIGLLSRLGMDLVLAHPEGYDLVPEIVDKAREQARASGGSFQVVHDMDEAFRDADVVYPKSWAPVAIMQKRTELLKAGRGAEVEELEREAIAMNSAHVDWETTEERMALTRDGKALYMHCLPADITGVSCEHGEVAASVFERYRVQTYHEAEHKLYVIAAMVLLARFPDAGAVVRQLVERGQPRRLG